MELPPRSASGPRRGRQPRAESRVALTLVVAWCEPMLAVLLLVVLLAGVLPVEAILGKIGVLAEDGT